jgi:transposase-like protein
MTTNHDLARQIEDLVRQHVDALRASAAAAVARAFGAVPPALASARASTPAKPVRTRKQGAPRRAPAELVALGERFYAVLCQRPGETMTTLAPQVGVAPRVLQVAVARLRRDGRVRVIGKRSHTRYYPMATSSLATTAAAA